MALVCHVAWAQTPVLNLTADEIGTFPYALPDEDADKVFALTDLTVAVRINTPSSFSGRRALFCTSDPTQAVNTSAMGTNSHYVGHGLNGGDIGYLASCRGGDRFTKPSIAANTNDVVLVFVMSPSVYRIYANGAELASWSGQFMSGYEIATPKMVKEDYAGAKIYIGGGVKSDNAGFEVFNGAITGVKVYDGVLTAEQVARVFTELDEPKEFRNGDVYTFETKRGWMGATESSNVISTAKTSVTPEASADNAMFQWTVYESANGNRYLYNLGKQQFMGVQSTNNASVPFAASPAGKLLTFKQSSSAEYPIMFSTDNSGVVNHSTSYGEGLITWTGGWNNLGDEGSNHKVTHVKTLTEAELATVADLVEAYDKAMPVKVEVEGLEANNPNTHFGNMRATQGDAVTGTKLTLKNMEVAYAGYNGVGDVIDFTREYRGFEFQGYYVGGQSMGRSFTLTEELMAQISEANPLVAKFTTTDEVTLFYDDDDFSYRIPAIDTTGTGRLIAVSDYRYSLDDIGRYNYGTANPGIDLVIRTSDDNGKTWSDKQTIAAGSRVRGTDDCAYGDAAIATVGEKVLVMAAAGDVMFGNGSATAHNRTVRVFSEDNGATWTKEDISETLFIGDDATIQNGYTAFFGSGLLAVDDNFNGTGKARIYGAMLIKKEGNGAAIYVIYTDDFGLTWSILGGSQTPVTSNDEPKVEILPNGQILLSVRRGGGRQFNVFTYTDKATNAGTWNGNVNGCSNGGSNTCNGEIYCIDAKKPDGTMTKLLLQSQPKGGSGLYDRRDVTIWYKEISATAQYTSEQIAGDWTEGLQVSTRLSAYSTMVMQEDGKVAFFFEEAPCYGDDYAKGYSMVYLPLTIESITKGNYFSEDADLSAAKDIHVVLTDAEGNTYRDQVSCLLDGVATALTAKYPYITLGDKANLEFDGTAYTYTNTVTLPFKVSNATATVWHNIWFPSNGNDTGYPVYMSAEESSDAVKIATEGAEYGSSTLNTLHHADKISWAFYQDGEGFAFKLKNKQNGLYVKTTSAATGSDGGENVRYTADIDEATAFSLTDGRSNSYRGDYGLTADGGYLMVWSVGHGRVTYSTNTKHQGAWVKIAGVPDFGVLIAEVNEVLSLLGEGLGQYTPTDADAVAAAKAAMENSGSVKLNDLNSYKALAEGATLNMPVAGRFFRIRGISGNYIDATGIYNNAGATTGQMSMKSAETCNYNGTVFYLDEENHLLNYATGTYVKQTREIGAVGDAKGTWSFAESPRKGNGRYALSCTTTGGAGTQLHDNSGNRADRCSSNCGERHDFTLEEVTALPVTISSIGYATLYTPVALAIPEGVAAYVGALDAEETELTLTGVEEVIPARTGVVLYRPEGSEATTHDFAIADDVEALQSAFVGSAATAATSGNPYTLQTHNGGVAFKQYTGDHITGFKAYLNLREESAAEAKAVRIRFAGEATSIDNSELSVSDSQSSIYYDLYGRRVTNPGKGVYIVGGKKVVIK